MLDNMKKIFDITVVALLKVAALFNLTYNEINIIVWYYLIPLLWAVLVDVKLGLPLTTPFVVAILGIVTYVHRKDFKAFCDWLFMKSVAFLLLFDKVGMNYTVASVVVCVLVPIIITVGLLLL